MLAEKKVLAAIMTSREAYDRMDDFLEEDDFTAQGRIILKAVTAYYAADGKAKMVDQGLLLEQIDKTLGNVKKLDTFKEVLANLPYDIGADNVSKSVLEQKREAAADRLANALAARSLQTRDVLDRLLVEYTEIHEVSDLSSTQGFSSYDVSVAKLFSEELADSRKIKILPKALNELIGGGAYPGHCIIVFGRVEMGKSMFVLNMSVGFVAQKLKVLYIENEDTLVDTQRRFVQRLIKRPRQWCKDNSEKAQEIALAKGSELFRLTEDPESAKDVESAIRYYQPDVVVINQMRNMVSGEGQVAKLDTLAHQLRRIGKKSRTLMVLVTAAKEGEDHHGNIREKIMLQRADVYSSRTGIPAAADLLLGWGGSEQMQANCQGALSVVKNKLVDEGGHGKFYCTVDPAIGKIEGEF